jgi:hypothetical protein
MDKSHLLTNNPARQCTVTPLYQLRRSSVPIEAANIGVKYQLRQSHPARASGNGDDAHRWRPPTQHLLVVTSVFASFAVCVRKKEYCRKGGILATFSPWTAALWPIYLTSGRHCPALPARNQSDLVFFITKIILALFFTCWCTLILITL